MTSYQLASIVIPPTLVFLGGLAKLLFDQNQILKQQKNTNEKIDRLSSDVNTLKKNDEAQAEYMQIIYRRRLELDIDKCLDAGFVSNYEYKEIMHLFEKYVKLGGNGYIDNKMTQLTKLWKGEK